uniref:Uncharacterized protein n=1 Tax=Meloidogyne enterolobii TaxID=390850 RepID=A0A6V7TUD0_MELEN|nr:unnamed protein product [Meloidogyne enterolobii]
MFLEYKNEEEDEEDSAVEDISNREEPRRGTGGELSQNKVFLFAKKKGWTAVRTQKLIDKLWKQQRWIRVMKGESRNKRRSNKVGDDQSIIRLHPCAMVEIEQLLSNLMSRNVFYANGLLLSVDCLILVKVVGLVIMLIVC